MDQNPEKEKGTSGKHAAPEAASVPESESSEVTRTEYDGAIPAEPPLRSSLGRQYQPRAGAEAPEAPPPEPTEPPEAGEEAPTDGWDSIEEEHPEAYSQYLDRLSAADAGLMEAMESHRQGEMSEADFRGAQEDYDREIERANADLERARGTSTPRSSEAPPRVPTEPTEPPEALTPVQAEAREAPPPEPTEPPEAGEEAPGPEPTTFEGREIDSDEWDSIEAEYPAAAEQYTEAMARADEELLAATEDFMRGEISQEAFQEAQSLYVENTHLARYTFEGETGIHLSDPETTETIADLATAIVDAAEQVAGEDTLDDETATVESERTESSDGFHERFSEAFDDRVGMAGDVLAEEATHFLSGEISVAEFQESQSEYVDDVSEARRLFEGVTGTAPPGAEPTEVLADMADAIAATTGSVASESSEAPAPELTEPPGAVEEAPTEAESPEAQTPEPIEAAEVSPPEQAEPPEAPAEAGEEAPGPEPTTFGDRARDYMADVIGDYAGYAEAGRDALSSLGEALRDAEATVRGRGNIEKTEDDKGVSKSESPEAQTPEPEEPEPIEAPPSEPTEPPEASAEEGEETPESEAPESPEAEEEAPETPEALETPEAPEQTETSEAPEVSGDFVESGGGG